MRKVNTTSGVEGTDSEVLITDFWNSVYLPYIKENLRHNTYMSYVKLYEKRLKAHFAEGRFTFPI